MRPVFEHTDYSTVLFMDSMVALEGKPLPDLPWNEIDPRGPILILVVPQVSAEIDKRKRDGRLSKRARAFNRLVSPAAESGLPTRIADGPPAVDIALARSAKIKWDELDDLDPDEPDARVVAQILYAYDVPDEKKLLLSHDINPIAMASRHGLGCKKLPDSWLSEPEPSPADKEIQRLKARLGVLETTEPQLTLELSFDVDSPLQIYRIGKLSEDQQRNVVTQVLAQNQRVSQRHSDVLGNALGYDAIYDEKYDTYCNNIVPEYAAFVHQIFEVHYGQVPFTFRLCNEGNLQAESLILTLQATGGTLHDRFTLYPLFGPTAPRPRPLLQPYMPRLDPSSLRSPVVGRHDIDFASGPDRSDTIEIHCADFRHGKCWTFSGIATIDPHSEEPLSIEVSATARNMRGEIKTLYKLNYEVEDVELSRLVDLSAKEYHIPIPMAEQFGTEINELNQDWFEFVALGGSSEEDYEDE